MHFCNADPQLKPKVTVEEVKSIFNQKYPGETNNTFGNIVRKAFPGVRRARDSVSYYYCPLKRKVSVSSQDQLFIGVTKTVENLDKCTQTLQSANTPTKDHLKSQITQLESKNSTLTSQSTLLEDKLKDTEEAAQICRQRNELLKRQISELQAKNKKLKDTFGKRHWADATQGTTNKRPKMLDVNLINKDDLEGEEVLIGEGSFGRCKLKTFVRTGTLVVVKEMKHESYESVIREAKVMQSLSSSRFPFAFGVLAKEQPYSIIMQFIGCPEWKRSSTLYQVVADKSEMCVSIRNSMSKSDWIRVCQDATDGVQHLHSAGFLHNDLKNNNILIHRKRAFIIDLGKACDASLPPSKKYSTFYSHIAPEVLQGRCCSFESDIFSLGQIFNFIRKFCHVVELRSIEKDCTLSNHVMRPTATYVANRLSDLSGKYY